jgi:aminoglycoside phosphotransferase (APT) family kinase protein
LPIRDLTIDRLGNRDGRDPNFITNEIDWAVRELHARFPENEEGERADLHSKMRRVLTEAASRLRDAVPSGVKPVLVHGDPTLANTMFHRDGSVAAILDWELAHAGIGAEDPYYFTYAARSIASLGSVKVELPNIEDALRYYEAAGGSLDHLEFASALTALRINIWGAIGMRRMPKAHWEAERLTWETQSSMLSDAMAKI